MAATTLRDTTPDKATLTPDPVRLLTAPLERRWLLLTVLVLAVIAALPGIVARYPQMTDYPAHLAAWYIMIDNGQNPVLARYYDFHWVWSGNLGTDLLVIPLAALFGLETAGRLLVILIPALSVAGLFAVEWTLRKRIGVGSLLSLATVWSPALLMGFLNFTLSLALALFAFALWVRMERSKWRAPAFIPIGLVVWLCHQSGWGVLGVMVFGYEFSRRPFKQCWKAALATWPLWFPVLPTLMATQQAPGSFNYGRHPLLLKWYWMKEVLRDRVRYLDYTTAVIFAALPIVALPFRKLDSRLAWAALGCALLALVVPRHLGGGDLADARLMAVTLMLALLAIDWRPTKGWVMGLALAPFLIRIAITTLVWNAHSRDVEKMMGALDHIPRGARVAVAVRQELTLWAQPLYGHLGCYATLRRDALVNAHFAIPGVHMLQLKPAAWRWVDPSHRLYALPGRQLNLTNFRPAKEADYLWYFGKLPPKALPAGAVVVFQTSHSLLAKLAPPPPADTAPDPAPIPRPNAPKAPTRG